MIAGHLPIRISLHLIQPVRPPNRFFRLPNRATIGSNMRFRLNRLKSNIKCNDNKACKADFCSGPVFNPPGRVRAVTAGKTEGRTAGARAGNYE